MVTGYYMFKTSVVCNFYFWSVLEVPINFSELFVRWMSEKSVCTLKKGHFATGSNLVELVILFVIIFSYANE